MSKMSNKKIAITGSMGSGKSTVSDLISQFYPTLSSDAIVDELYRDKNFIRKVNHLIYNEDNDVLDKSRLAKTIFNDELKKETLEALIHPIVKMKILQFQKENSISFTEVPLLFEAGFESFFDIIIVVTASDEVVYDRLKKGRGYSKKEITERLNHQLSKEYKKGRADFVIENNGSLKYLEIRVEEVLKIIEKED